MKPVRADGKPARLLPELSLCFLSSSVFVLEESNEGVAPKFILSIFKNDPFFGPSPSGLILLPHETLGSADSGSVFSVAMAL